MSIVKLCPYDKSEHCKYERYYGEPMFSKCKNCEIKNSGRYETKEKEEGVTMFEKEAEEYFQEQIKLREEKGIVKHIKDVFKDGAEFGYEECKEELTERLENATEIIEQMKDLFFTCWQEKGYNAIKFEQKVNDFLKENK